MSDYQLMSWNFENKKKKSLHGRRLRKHPQACCTFPHKIKQYRRWKHVSFMGTLLVFAPLRITFQIEFLLCNHPPNFGPNSPHLHLTVAYLDSAVSDSISQLPGGVGGSPGWLSGDVSDADGGDCGL